MRPHPFEEHVGQTNTSDDPSALGRLERFARWTHKGLRLLFEKNSNWSRLSAAAAAGTGSALTMLLATYVEIALRRGVIARLPRAVAQLSWLVARRGESSPA